MGSKKTAKRLLPTQAGYYFGDTDYNEDYIYDLEDTVKQLDKIIAETDFNNEVIEYYAWW